jgi:undecaprenyl-diphosphatase
MAGLLRLDGALRTWVVLHRAVFLNRPFLVFSDIAWLGMLWLLIAVALAWRRTIRWSDVARLVLALVMGALLTDHLLKPLIGRKRPFVTSAVAAVIGHAPQGGSFPSGHATAAFA